MTSHRLMRLLGGFAVLFGLLTVLAGARALFGGPEARAEVGDAVPFVLWFNTLAGVAYVAAGIGLWCLRAWASHLALLIAVATLLVLAVFAFHVVSGGAFETRTVIAMTVRSLVWLAIAVLSRRLLAAVG